MPAAVGIGEQLNEEIGREQIEVDFALCVHRLVQPIQFLLPLLIAEPHIAGVQDLNA